jgi:hypothetical protein
MDVEKLTTELRSLVLGRQPLHERGASANERAQKRLGLVRVQWQLAYAYIEQPALPPKSLPHMVKAALLPAAFSPARVRKSAPAER